MNDAFFTYATHDLAHPFPASNPTLLCFLWKPMYKSTVCCHLLELEYRATHWACALGAFQKQEAKNKQVFRLINNPFQTEVTV